MTMTQIPDVIPDEAAHQLAFTEVSFLLDIFAATIEELMGGATASVGRIAGRELARKLPIDDVNSTDRKAVVRQVAAHFQNGYSIHIAETDSADAIPVNFKTCAIREVCNKRQLALGGELCRLFHFYFDGVVNELVKSPVKSEVVPGDDVCRCNMRFK